MLGRIELSRTALADLDDIYDYIARENPRAAAQVVITLQRVFVLCDSAGSPALMEAGSS